MNPHRVYFREFDALRFFAALLVVGFHVANHIPFPPDQFHRVARVVLSFNGAGGGAGVQFFFVLSGFLITYLMLSELRSTGTFSILHFYARRLLRIWPLYYAVMLIGFVGYPALMSALGVQFSERASPLLYGLYLANFDHIYNGLPASGVLGVQWSVAIEEQFYLLWPLLFAVVGRRRSFPWFVALLIVATSCFHAASRGDARVAYYHTICAMSDLGIGALFAYVCFHSPERVCAAFARLPRSATAATYVVGLAALLVQFRLSAIPWVFPLFRPCASLFFTFVILEQSYSPRSLFKASSVPGATRLGRVSYGLYLLHMIPITLAVWVGKQAEVSPWVLAVAAVGGAIAMSLVSFRVFESPFLAIKERFVR